MAVDTIRNAMAEIDARLKLVEEKEAALKKLEDKMKENAEKAKTIINLKIGGPIFTTSKSTLLKFEGSYFHTLLGSDRWKPEEDGCYFVDRSPEYFKYLMEYMRTGTLETEGLSQKDIDHIHSDFDYYQVPLPQVPLFQAPLKQRWDPNYCGVNIQLSQKNVVATKIGGNGWNAVLGTEPNQTYKVKLVNRGTNGLEMIGMAPRNGFKVNGLNQTSCGWYLYCHEGTLCSQQGDSYRAYATAIGNGSVVEVVFDAQKREISFTIDGVSKGVAFSNLPQGDFYPAVGIWDQRIVLELM